MKTYINTHTNQVVPEPVTRFEGDGIVRVWTEGEVNAVIAMAVTMAVNEMITGADHDYSKLLER